MRNDSPDTDDCRLVSLAMEPADDGHDPTTGAPSMTQNHTTDPWIIDDGARDTTKAEQLADDIVGTDSVDRLAPALHGTVDVWLTRDPDDDLVVFEPPAGWRIDDVATVSETNGVRVRVSQEGDDG